MHKKLKLWLILALIIAVTLIIYTIETKNTYKRAFIGELPALTGCTYTCIGVETEITCNTNNYNPPLKTCTYKCSGVLKNSCK